MTMYKKAYLTLFKRMSEAMEKIDEVVKGSEDRYTRVQLYDTYSILSRAQQEAEEIIINSEEEME